MTSPNSCNQEEDELPQTNGTKRKMEESSEEEESSDEEQMPPKKKAKKAGMSSGIAKTGVALPKYEGY